MNSETTPNRTFVGGSIGSALGVMVVVMAPKLSEVTWSTDDATLMTAALGIFFGWVVRYLPMPKTK